MILPRTVKSCPATSEAMTPGTTEQPFEEVTERIGATGLKAATTELKTGVPVGRRFELLPCLPVGAEFIVGGTFLRVLEDGIRFAKILEKLLCVRAVADIRMVLACQATIGFFISSWLASRSSPMIL